MWQVGDSGHIRVWEDIWIPQLKGQKLKGINYFPKLRNLRVCNIINKEPWAWAWDLRSLQGRINPTKIKAIGCIALVPSNRKDILVWPFEKRG